MSIKVLPLLLTLLLSCVNNGIEEGFYKSGELKYEVSTEGGLRHGKLKKYYQNGALMMISQWERGKKHGEAISYYENGEVQITENYIESKANGKFYYYDSLGVLRETVEVRNDLRDGETVLYRLDGRIKGIDIYKEGQFHGKRVRYNKKGNEIQRLLYENDTVIYSVDLYDDGTISNRLLPITIKPDKLNSNKIGEPQLIEIGISQAYFDNSHIVVYIGRLNPTDGETLIDTLRILKSDNLKVDYSFSPTKRGNLTISGIVKEKGGDLKEVQNFQSFKHEFEVH